MPDYFIGLMSGTSLDGIDAVLVRFGPNDFTVVATHYQAYESNLRARLQRLCYAESAALAALGALDAELGEIFAGCCEQLLDSTGIGAGAVRAIGSHGQTVYHHPRGSHPFTLQIGDPNRLAQRTGITTVADFRRRDIAAGGQGAPLAPGFHRAIFSSPATHTIVANVGGIANLTILPPEGCGEVLGFDCGPGNTLMDLWAERHLGTGWDAGGNWARGGQADTNLLARLLDDTYFRAAPPKSTGQEYFSAQWLTDKLDGCSLSPQDIQATLCLLTATAIIDAATRWSSGMDRILVCGGGSKNAFLMETLNRLAHCPVTSTEPYGVHPDWVEAVAFAWLARQTVMGLPGNLPSVTGASRPVILGAVYPGNTG